MVVSLRLHSEYPIVIQHFAMCNDSFSPTAPSGQLIAANKLWKHAQTHSFGLRCFHDIAARMFCPVSGEYAGQPIAACGHRQRSEDCKFWSKPIIYLIFPLFLLANYFSYAGRNSRKPKE
jgi:hypothetical protein